MNDAILPAGHGILRIFDYLQRCVMSYRHTAEAPYAISEWPAHLSARESTENAQESFSIFVQRRAAYLVDEIEYKLHRDLLDAQDSNEIAPTFESIDGVNALARELAPYLALTPELRWSACSDEAGGAVLVAQSLKTERRLTCQIAANGRKVAAICIDEHMQCQRMDLAGEGADSSRELAAWLSKQS